MTIGTVLEVHAILKQLSGLDSPLKLTFARNLVITTPVVDKFNISKDDKFKSVVSSDEKGMPAPTQELMEALNKGTINPSQGLPFEAYEFETETGLQELKDYIDTLKDKKKTIKFVGASLTKIIRMKEDGKEVELVALADLLEAPNSVINPEWLIVLMSAGIITE